MANKTPADKTILDKILSPSRKADASNYQTKLNAVEELADTFATAIEQAGRKIKSNECTDRAKDYLDKITGGRFSSITDKISGYSKIGGNYTSFNMLNDVLSVTGSVLNTSSTTKWEDMICSTVPIVSSAIVKIIEAIIALAIKLFKKIDRFRKKLEAAIKFYIQEVRNCIIKMIKDIELYLHLSVSDVTGADTLSKLLDSPCGSCLRELLLSMVPAKWRKACKDKSTGAELVACLESQMGLDTLNIFIDGINQWIDENIITKYIIGAFNALEKAINTILNTIMKPFRWAIKSYCRLLNKKLPAPFIGNPLNECFFVYSKDKKGRFTMSVLQYIETLKLWTKCFNSICGLLSDDLKRKIKQFNEDLRLNIKYWLGGSELDIYRASIETTRLVKDTDVKALWTALHKDPFKETLDFIKDSKESLSREDTQPLNAKEEEEISPLLDSLTTVNGSDSEMFPINQGHLLFYSKYTEQSIIKTIMNISSVQNFHNWRERLNELMKWENPYKKSQEHLDVLYSANNYGVEVDDSFNAETLNDFYSILPTYLVTSDYYTLNPIPKPEKHPNEPMIDYYKRWYDETVKQS